MTITDQIRRHVGRRYRIAGAEMAPFLQALLIEQGIGHERCELVPHYDSDDPAAPSAGDVADKAAAMVRRDGSITCICLVRYSDGMGLRFDEPGSMHPQQHSAAIFAPAGMAAGTYEYLRERCGRLLIVSR